MEQTRDEYEIAGIACSCVLQFICMPVQSLQRSCAGELIGARLNKITAKICKSRRH